MGEDAATGFTIKSKEAFYGLLEQELAVDDLLLVKVQIQNLTLINAQFGNSAGDEIITAVRHILTSMHMIEAVGQISVSLYGAISKTVADPHKVYEELNRAVKKINEASGEQYLIDLAVGMVLMPTGTETNIKNWTNKADKAVVVSARTGQPVIYDEQLEQEIALRLEIGRLNHEAERPQGMSWVFQPVVDLDTRETVGYEVLVRWDLDGFGPVSPDLFIPIAEELGTVGVLDLWALQHAVDALPVLMRSQNMGIGVNLSAVTIERDHKYLAALEEFARAGVFAKHQIILEMTETSVVRNISLAENQLQRVLDLGVSLAIDDFGKGETNFGILSRLDFSYLKIDKGLLRLGTEQSQAQILAIAKQVGAVLGADVLQEGIENQADLDAVRNAGIRLGQGWFLGLPKALADLNSDQSPTT